jgi:parallel beta-helix repeat protein
MKLVYLQEYRRYIIAGILICLFNPINAQLPVVENVHFTQRTDGSLLVDIYYDVTTAGGLPLEVTVEASDDNGLTWDLPCSSLTGDVGEYIYEGTDKHVVWDFYGDNPNISGSNFKVRVSAECMICGQRITEDFTLTEDLYCPDGTHPFFHVAASNITVDLGGYRVAGDMFVGDLEGIWIGPPTEGDGWITGTTLKNGFVEGFGIGIAVGKSDSVVIENISISNLENDDPQEMIVGISASKITNALIRNCRFEFLPVVHKEAIIMGDSTEFTIQDNYVLNASVGVNFGGNLYPSNGTVINNVFEDVTLAGILYQKSDSSLIIDNDFINNEIGIQIDARFPRRVTGAVIEGNRMSDGFMGILSQAAEDIIIKNNTIQNAGGIGISLVSNMDCPWEEYGYNDICYCSTSNLILGNKVTGCGIDLFHQEECVGNTWEDNDCETSEGSEIPLCTPQTATAGEYFSSVDSAASELAGDAGLIKLISHNCDSTGRSYKWYYIYESIVQQERYEIWYYNGELIVQDSVTLEREVPEPDPYPQITGLWMDSDSALSLANDQGGRDFIEQTEFIKVDASLIQSGGDWLFWDIWYFAQDSMLLRRIDALIPEE